MTPETRIEIVKAQEEQAIFPQFDETVAFELGLTLAAIARDEKAPVAIDIRTADRILFHLALPGAVPDNDHWIARKAAVALRMQQSSLRVGDGLATRNREVGPAIGLDPLLYAAHGGAFPIRVRGAGMVAVMTVSGLPQLDDHRMAVAAIERHLGISLPGF